jgi:excisionase family DNA binding protein
MYRRLTGNVVASSNKCSAMPRTVMASPLLDWFVPPMKNGPEPAVRLLTTKETAELLQVSRRTLQRLIERNKLPAVKVGSRWRIRESELAKWIQSLNEL